MTARRGVANEMRANESSTSEHEQLHRFVPLLSG
jgi:hypothetical protein